MFTGSRSISKALRQKDPAQRQQAVDQLVSMGPAAADVLRRALNDRRYWTREAAIQAYQAMGPRAVPLLIDNLNSSSSIAQKSHQLLATFPAEQAVPPLLATLQQGRGRAAWRAVNLLIDFEERAVPGLHDFLRSPGLSRAARNRADYVLSRIYGCPSRREIRQVIYWLAGSLVAGLLVLAAGLVTPFVRESFLAMAGPVRAALGLGYLAWAVAVLVAWLMYRAARRQLRYSREGLLLGRHLAEEFIVLGQIVLLAVAGFFSLLAAVIAPVAAVYLVFQIRRLWQQRREFERQFLREARLRLSV